MKRRLGLWITLALTAAIIGLVAPAHADVVAPPESGTCPEGTDPVQSHGISPSRCDPRICTSDSECASGMVCVVRKYCTYNTETCETATDCPNSTCEAKKVCLDQSDTSAGSSGTGDGGKGGCSVNVGAEGPALLALGVLVLVHVAGRRRRAG